jgi:hypothetical protein
VTAYEHAHARKQVQGDVPIHWAVWPSAEGGGGGAGGDGSRDKSADGGASAHVHVDAVVDLSKLDSPQTGTQPEVHFLFSSACFCRFARGGVPALQGMQGMQGMHQARCALLLGELRQIMCERIVCVVRLAAVRAVGSVVTHFAPGSVPVTVADPVLVPVCVCLICLCVRGAPRLNVTVTWSPRLLSLARAGCCPSFHSRYVQSCVCVCVCVCVCSACLSCLCLREG